MNGMRQISVGRETEGEMFGVTHALLFSRQVERL
jgi:hypothetical protein